MGGVICTGSWCQKHPQSRKYVDVWILQQRTSHKCNNTNFATKMLVPLCQLSTAKFWQHPKTSDLVAGHPGTLGNLRKRDRGGSRVRCSQADWSPSRCFDRKRPAGAKNAWSSQTPVIGHVLSSVVIIWKHQKWRDLCRAETSQPRKWDVIAVYGFISWALSLSNALDFYRRPLIRGRKQVFLHKSWNALHLHHGVSAHWTSIWSPTKCFTKCFTKCGKIWRPVTEKRA